MVATVGRTPLIEIWTAHIQQTVTSSAFPTQPRLVVLAVILKCVPSCASLTFTVPFLSEHWHKSQPAEECILPTKVIEFQSLTQSQGRATDWHGFCFFENCVSSADANLGCVADTGRAFESQSGGPRLEGKIKGPP